VTSLLALLFVEPLVPTAEVGGLAENTVLTVLAWSLGLASILVQAGAGSAVALGFQMSLAVLTVLAVLILRASHLILRSLLRDHAVDGETILGALGLYILLVVAWATVFSLLELFHPGSFSNLNAQGTGDGGLIPSRPVFFSFVTLTTLGHGDITPLTPLSERLAVVEAIVGQFYIAVVVAYLDAAYLAHRRDAA
jgi:hypothetical protein